VELPNPERRIVGGQYARGRIALGITRATVVPFAAVRGAAADGTGGHVYLVRDGRIVRRPVTLGARDEVTGTVAITAGIEAGELVIVIPSADVTEGAAVRVATSDGPMRESVSPPALPPARE
jgi:hypothetical protein